MQEIWKDIKGFEGLYQVSNYGRIKSLKRITLGKKYGIHKLKEKILKPNKNGKYCHVCLRKGNKNSIKYIHRIVAENFIENSNNYKDVNHKDGNTRNNNIDNLEWCTRSYNVKHSYDVLKRKKNLTGIYEYIESRKRKIIQYDFEGKFVKIWNSISEAEKFLKTKNVGKICLCCQHKRKSAFGYKWEYYQKNEISR